MPSRDWSFRIADILGAISAVQQYTAGMHFKDFTVDRKTVDAVVRNFIAIGEAAARVPEEVCQAHPKIPWSDMRAMRNFVVHDYFGVDDRVLWDTVQTDLPPIIPLLKVLMERQSQAGGGK